MKVDASSVGVLASEATLSSRSGTVRHVFAKTIYLEHGNGMTIITKTKPRSPIAINIPDGEPSFLRTTSPGADASMTPSQLVSGLLHVDLTKAELFFPPQIQGIPTEGLEPRLKKLERPLKESALLLKILYQASPEFKETLLAAPETFNFIETVCEPLASGDPEPIYSEKPYRLLLGRGIGFTPSGDDFLSGFISLFNVFHQELGLREIAVERSLLLDRTSWVSALLFDYLQHGVADEMIDCLLRRMSHGLGDSIPDAVLDLASRGHTSGLDFALGAVVAASAVHDWKLDGDVLTRVVEAIL